MNEELLLNEHLKYALIYKYDSNLKHDLLKIVEQPHLMKVFKEIYPEEYHNDAEEYMKIARKQKIADHEAYIDKMLRSVYKKQKPVDSIWNDYWCRIFCECVIKKAMKLHVDNKTLNPKIWHAIGREVKSAF